MKIIETIKSWNKKSTIFGKPIIMARVLIWNSGDFFSAEWADPINTMEAFFHNRGDAEKWIMSVTNDGSYSIYFDAELYEYTFNSLSDIVNCLEILKEEVEEVEEQMESLFEGCSSNYFEGKAIEFFLSLCPEGVPCNNYDFDSSLQGKLIAIWSWETHVGYARKLHELRWATIDETAEMLAPVDQCYKRQCSIVGSDEDDEEDVYENLFDGSWKWTNPGFVRRTLDEAFGND